MLRRRVGAAGGRLDLQQILRTLGLRLNRENPLDGAPRKRAEAHRTFEGMADSRLTVGAQQR